MTEDALTQILTAFIAAVSAWIVAHYTIIRSAKKDAKERQEQLDRDARYLAIRVVCLLDPFIYTCCSVAIDDGEPGADGEFRPTTEAPTINLPTGVEWRSLDPELMYRILSLPNEIDTANHSISGAMEHAATAPEYSDYFLRRRQCYARLGLCAISLANDLRGQFNIPAREDRDEDPEAHLNDALSKALREELLNSPMGSIIRHEEAKSALKVAGMPFDNGI
jgi:hypothetical protein